MSTSTIEMNQKIQAAIEEHLPSQLGQHLAARLKQAEDDAAAVKRLLAENGELLKKVGELRAKESDLEEREREVREMASNLSLRESALAKKEVAAEVVQVKLECAERRIADMRAVVQDVFSNNRFKYQEYSSFPFQVPGQSYPTTVNASKTIETQC